MASFSASGQLKVTRKPWDRETAYKAIWLIGELLALMAVARIRDITIRDWKEDIITRSVKSEDSGQIATLGDQEKAGSIFRPAG